MVSYDDVAMLVSVLYINVCSTFVCPTEIIAFSDRIAEFQALDTAVIGASTDSHFSHLAWINMPRKVSKAFHRFVSACNDRLRHHINSDYRF